MHTRIHYTRVNTIGGEYYSRAISNSLAVWSGTNTIRGQILLGAKSRRRKNDMQTYRLTLLNSFLKTLCVFLRSIVNLGSNIGSATVHMYRYSIMCTLVHVYLTLGSVLAAQFSQGVWFSSPGYIPVYSAELTQRAARDVQRLRDRIRGTPIVPGESIIRVRC